CRVLSRSALFGIFVLAPFLLFWWIFAAQGTAVDYLSSFFLYPAIYGFGNERTVTNIAREALTIVAGFADSFLLTIMFAGAVAAFLLSEQSSRPASGRFADPRWLILITTIFLITALLTVRMWLPYYIVLVAGPMALFCGVIFGDHWSRAWRASSLMASAVIVAIIIGAAALTARTWSTNALSNNSIVPPRNLAPVQAGPSSRYAYQLGQQVDFYASGRFIPASSLQFVWAFPQTPDIWAYKKPVGDTFIRRLLSQRQAQNVTQLYADFSRTPPSYILLQSNFARVPHSANAVDIPGFQDYLDRHCRFAETTDITTSVSLSLYKCGNSPGQNAVP